MSKEEAVNNDAFLDLIRDRAKKAAWFVEEAGREATRQSHILNGTRLALIAASAVTARRLASRSGWRWGGGGAALAAGFIATWALRRRSLGPPRGGK